jgi:adenylate kinase family enzyme
MSPTDQNIQVIVISGAAASGKSTYAKKLKARQDLSILDLDDKLSELIDENQKLINEVGMEAFLKIVRDDRYADLQKRGIEIVKKGASVALVAPFSRHIHDETLWENFCRPFIELGTKPELHWLKVSDVERASRLARRGAIRDVEKVSSEESLREYLDSTVQLPPSVPHLEIDGFFSLDH